MKNYRRVDNLDNIIEGLSYAKDSQEFITLWQVNKKKRIIIKGQIQSISDNGQSFKIKMEQPLNDYFQEELSQQGKYKDPFPSKFLYVHCLDYFMVFKVVILNYELNTLTLQVPEEVRIVELRNEKRIPVKKSAVNIVCAKVIDTTSHRKRLIFELCDISLRGLGLLALYTQTLAVKPNSDIVIESIGHYEFTPPIRAKVVYVWQGKTKQQAGYSKRISKIGITFERPLPSDIGIYIEL